MVIIRPPEDIHVQRHVCGLCPTSYAMMNHLCIQITNHWRRKPEFTHEERTRWYVKNSPGKSFVERGVSVAKASDSGPHTQSLVESAAKG